MSRMRSSTSWAIDESRRSADSLARRVHATRRRVVVMPLPGLKPDQRGRSDIIGEIGGIDPGDDRIRAAIGHDGGMSGRLATKRRGTGHA